MVKFQSPAALLGLAQDMIMKGWQPIWCPARQSGSFTPLPGCTGGDPFPSVLPQPQVAHKLAFRPPPDVLVIDVDHYDSKTGMDTMDRAEAWLGDLPDTYRVTSRGYINPSGRYLYRMPADLLVTDSSLYQFADEDGRTDVEIVRTGHRFSWAAGDYHYKNDELIVCYDEYGDACEMPDVNEIPELPEKWVAYFRNPPVAQKHEVYTRPSDGAEWWLSQADDSLGSDAELASFAYNMLLSRMDVEEIFEQWFRVARADNPGWGWSRSDFDRHVGARAQGKADTILAHQDNETEWFAGTGADLDRIAQQTTEAYELRQAVAIEPQVPYDPALLHRFADRAGLPLPIVSTDDEDDEVLIDVELAARAQPGYQSLLWQELMRTFAKREAMKMLQGKFQGYEDIGEMPDPPQPELLIVTGKESISTAVVGRKTVTVLSGHRASGKTWISAVWASQVITAGGYVVWIDFERQAHGLSQKLRAVGLKPHLINSSLKYTSRLPSSDRLASDIHEYAVSGKPVLLVVDAFRGLQNTLSPLSSANDGDAVEQVYLEYLNPCAEAGATIVLLDHLAKAGNGTTFGSERKESAADYVIRVEQAAAFTKTAPGFSSMEVTKDRYGVIAAGSAAGYLWMPGDGRATGKSVEQYPKTPELRAWSPNESSDAQAIELSQKGSRELAVTTMVRDNPLAYGPRPLGTAVHAVYPDLFETPKAATDFASRMRNEGKLIKEEGRDGKYDLPAVTGTKLDPRLLQGGDDHQDN